MLIRVELNMQLSFLMAFIVRTFLLVALFPVSNMLPNNLHFLWFGILSSAGVVL